MPTMTPRKSSNIAATGYDPKTLVLTIQFVGDGARIHSYTGVEPEVAAMFDRVGASAGRIFSSRIRGQYDHVPPETTAEVAAP